MSPWQKKCDQSSLIERISHKGVAHLIYEFAQRLPAYYNLFPETQPKLLNVSTTIQCQTFIESFLFLGIFVIVLCSRRQLYFIRNNQIKFSL